MKRKQQRRHNRIENRGFTLVELVVSMALTAILATAVTSIIFPIVSIFMDMQKLNRAQMVADTVTDALRKECATSYVTGVADVKILSLPDKVAVSEDGKGLTTELANQVQSSMAISQASGNALIFSINPGYAKAIYWNTPVTKTDYNEVLANNGSTAHVTSAASKVVSSRAVYRLFPDGVSAISKEEDLPLAARAGYLHYGYYETTIMNTTDHGKEVAVFTPTVAYDYTNPFSTSVYNGFTISVDFSDLTYEDISGASSESNADRRPVCVVATVKVFERGDNLVCSRQAVLCFAEDNKR